ncbi:uncharacterized protein METZ01_LOCUS466427, partial [marine metagenome]
RHMVEGRGGYPAIINADVNADPEEGAERQVTYQQLAERVNRCGNLLRSLASEPGGRILMVVKDCPEFFYIFWGAIKAGLVPVPLNTLLRADDYRFMIEDSDCTGLVYSPEYQSEITSALAASGHHPAFVLCTEGPSGMSGLLQDYSFVLEPASATADSECFWLYSSGSTGRPKGAMITYGMCLYNSVHCDIAVSLSPQSTNLVFLPTFHTAGLNIFANPAFHLGARNVIMRAFDPDQFCRVLSDKDIA